MMFTETAMMPAPVRLVFFPDVRPAESKDVKMQVMLSITGRTGLAPSLTMRILLSITIAASNGTRPHFCHSPKRTSSPTAPFLYT